MMRKAIIKAVTGMTEEQAAGLWRAVSQWAENTRCGLDETDDEPSTLAKLELQGAELIEQAGDTATAQLAESTAPHTVLHRSEGCVDGSQKLR